MANASDTIVAQATPAGRGGVGIVRISGPLAEAIGNKICNKTLHPRQAYYLPFLDTDHSIIDQGIALFFKGPNSFTGEDVIELQGHGGPIIIDMLLERILKEPGVRLARPGEFSEQAFLNDKLDLAQAEAIADLIEANSRQAAKSALQSLQGAFSEKINALSDQIIHLRMYVEAAIDFPEEEIDFLNDGKVSGELASIIATHKALLASAQQGTLLRDGMQVVIAGRPNAGKSSLLNKLAGRESAIVTDIAGTTRDILKEFININGVPLHIIDTAGLRESNDKVEQIGIERAWDAINQADHVLFVLDASSTNAEDPFDVWSDFMLELPDSMPVTLVRNKIDKTDEQAGENTVNTAHGEYPVIRVSSLTEEGIDALREHLATVLGLASATEGQFIARRRHLDALNVAEFHLNSGKEQLENALAGELLAEELRLAHQALCEITGEFTSDDLLGKIFSSFCIGK